MKKIFLSSILAVLMTVVFSNQIFAADTVKEAKIKTSAFSWMCKNKIESAVKDFDGVKSADLNLEEKVLTVKFDETKIDVEKISQKIKDLGYTAEYIKEKPADNKAGDKNSGEKNLMSN